MLKPVRMVKVSVVGPKDYFEIVSEKMYQLNAIHIEDPVEDEYFRLGEPFKKAGKVSKYLVQLRSLISHIKLDPESYFPKRKYREEEIKAELDRKIEEYRELIGSKIDRIKELQEKIKALEEELRVLEPLKELGLPPRLLKGYTFIRVFAGFVKSDPTDKIKEITSDFEIFIKDVGVEYVVAIFVKNEFAEQVYGVLQEFGFREISVPDVEDVDREIEKVTAKIQQLKEEIEKIEKEIEEIKEKEADEILAVEEYLTMELEKSELPLRSLVSKYVFLVVGYLPAKSYDEFKNYIESETDGKVAVELLDEEEDFDPPTLLDNPPYVRDFEVLTKTFAIPKYNEIDPTLIMSIFFPLFFGMMLGDMGYGALIVIVALYLKKIYKTEGWQKLLNVALYSGIATIFFGFIYGECFGPFVVGKHSPSSVHFLGSILYNLYAFNHHHPIFDRVEEFGVKSLLFLTLVVGMFKLLWGFALGFRNVAVEHGIKEAILEKGCWFLGVLGLCFIIFGFSYNLGIFTTPPPDGFGKLLPTNLYVFGHYTVANGAKVPLPIPVLVHGWQMGVNVFYLAALPLLIAWFVLFLMAEVPKMGPMGAIMGVELLTWFGQILSYARLLAIGLSSVYFAFVFNYLGLKMAFPPGMAILPLGILMILGGHIINFVLGILDPGLQSLRLHYVEFFTKFFEGGGRLYKPFGRIKKFLE